jgi:hypothetical protein
MLQGLLPRLRHAGALPAWLDVGAVPELPCVLHRTHSPVHRTVELHHVIPVAWQLLMQPASKPWPNEGRDPDGRGLLFDARGVQCCPTGHRNVHLWLTRLMHAMVGNGEDPQRACVVVRAQFGAAAHGLEFDTALLAMTRWKEAGLSLQQLVQFGEWGMSLPAPRKLAQEMPRRPRGDSTRSDRKR